MQEQWYRIIERELEFLLTFEEYKKDLYDRLEELKYIPYPGTIYDEDMGNIYYRGQKVESYVLDKVDKEQTIKVAIERGEKRIKRLLNAMDQQLTDDERSILYYVYLYENKSDLPISLHRYLGFRNKQTLERATTKALKKVYEQYRTEREDEERERERLRAEELKRKAEVYKKFREKADL